MIMEQWAWGNSALILNVLIQIINLAIFFWVFKRLFANEILQWVDSRRKLLDKIKNAEQEYNSMIDQAKSESSQIIDEALLHKKKIEEGWKIVAEQEKKKILDSANKKAKDLIDGSRADIEKTKKDLETNWENWVKATAKVVVKKIFEGDNNLKDQYVDKVLQEFKL